MESNGHYIPTNKNFDSLKFLKESYYLKSEEDNKDEELVHDNDENSEEVRSFNLSDIVLDENGSFFFKTNGIRVYFVVIL